MSKEVEVLSSKSEENEEQHNHGHKHNHSHNHDVTNVKTINLVITMLLNFIITLFEVVGGLYARSLSLVSDGLHNFSDGVAIIISYIALKLSKRDNNENKTFGYKRSSILAAFINSSVLMVISVFLFKEAYNKFFNPEPINGKMVIIIAVVGLIANTLGAYLLHKGSEEDMNIKASYLHLLSDALSSVAVIIGGAMIYYFNIYWIDPLLTVCISLYVLIESFKIMKDAVNILMQGTPENIDINKVVNVIKEFKDVQDVHHVHLWALDEKNINFEAHINIDDMLVSETKELYNKIEEELHEHFEINHVTLQFENNCCKDVGIIKKSRLA